MIARLPAIARAVRRAIAAVLQRLSDPITALVCIGVLLIGAALGTQHARNEQRLADARAAEAHALAEAARTIADAQTADRVVTQYVDRVRTVSEAAQVITKEVPVYVPSDACTLPPGFRVLHDAAAAGTLPEPAYLADAAPADAQTVAATVADNYATCHAIREQLTALQQFERERAVGAP
jgi:K+-sensing histidine kinase KdpD